MEYRRGCAKASPLPRLAGKTAIVTGAAGGIGLAIAKRLVAEGAGVCLTARDPNLLHAAVDELGGRDNAVAVVGDIDDVTHQIETMHRAMEAFGSIDVLVNNIGANPAAGSLLELDYKSAGKVIESNCISAISWVQQAHKAWLGEHGGSIVNITSIAGLKPAPGIAFEGATAAMLIHLTRELAVELSPHIRVNAVAPPTVCPGFATVDPSRRAMQNSLLSAKCNTEEISGVVAFLASSEAAWLSGQIIAIQEVLR
ncbi:SDR family oxidoreductase [Nocardia sp. KC 131]|uniref:SDR family oxidoreductase n=1 Tax=Nocardia arseniciresistens TaxID=3392119 RepID=UPI00398E572B